MQMPRHIKEANKAVETAHNFYRRFVEQACEHAGGYSVMSQRMGHSGNYITVTMGRDNFSAIKELANEIYNEYEYK